MLFCALPVALLAATFTRLTLAQVASGTPEAVPQGPTSSADAAGYNCDPSTCKLPDCLCASTSPPGGLSPSEIPQFVVWTSDDAMNIYTDAAVDNFLGSLQNPNGCPVKSTYYVSMNNHNYSLATDAYVNGNEIACHTVNHEAGSATNPDEIHGNVEMLNRWSGIPFSALKGFRAPFLNITVDTLEILADQGFTYDSSFVSASPLESDDTDAFWPYTLDNGLANNCLTVEGACQGQPQLPGFWEIPMYSMFSNEGDGTAVTVMDPYLSSTDTDEVLDLMKANFQKHYDGNRQPFGLYMHPAHLVSGYPGVSDPTETIDMLKEFLDWVQDHDDVYFITNEQLLAWMQEPKAISDLDSLDFLQCDMPDVSDDICNGMSPNQEGLLIQCSYEALNWGASSCYGCPNKQPTVEDPTPDQDTSEGRQERQALPQDCGTAWWDPVKGECLCQGDDCAFTDTSRELTDDTNEDDEQDDDDKSSALHVPCSVLLAMLVIGLSSWSTSF